MEIIHELKLQQCYSTSLKYPDDQPSPLLCKSHLLGNYFTSSNSSEIIEFQPLHTSTQYRLKIMDMRNSKSEIMNKGKVTELTRILVAPSFIRDQPPPLPSEQEWLHQISKNVPALSHSTIQVTRHFHDWINQGLEGFPLFNAVSGSILHGRPGTGKSLLAKTIAGKSFLTTFQFIVHCTYCN